MLLEEENFAMIRQYFIMNNEILELRDFVVAVMENFKEVECKVGLVKLLIDLFKDIDIDGNGVLEFKEFLQYLIDFQKRSQGSDESAVNTFQRLFESNGSSTNDLNRFTLGTMQLPEINFGKSRHSFWARDGSYYLLVSVIRERRFHIFGNKLINPRSLCWEDVDPEAKPSQNSQPFIDFCLVPRRLLLLVLFKDEVISYNLSSLKLEDRYRTYLKSPQQIIPLCQKHFLIIHSGNLLTFYSRRKELKIINRLMISGGNVKVTQVYANRCLAFTDDQGVFYAIMRCPIKKVYLVRTIFTPLPGHLIKGLYVLGKSDQALFWGFSCDFVMYFSTEWISNRHKISLHTNEIDKVEYLPSRNFFVSVDVKGVVIIWSASNFHKYQTFSLVSSVSSIQIIDDQSKILFLTRTGAVFAEGFMLATYFSHLRILSFSYNSSSRKFIMVTNRDLRAIDAITGEVSSFIANVDQNFKESLKCIEPNLKSFSRSKQAVPDNSMDSDFLVLLTEYDNTASLFSLKNYQKLVEVIPKRTKESEKEEQIEVISIVRYLPFLDCYAVGYSNSFIKIFKQGASKNQWTKKLSWGHDESKITAIDSYEHVLVSGSKNGRIAVWSLSNNMFYRIKGSQNSSIRSIIFLSVETFVSVAKYDRPIIYHLGKEGFFEARKELEFPNISVDFHLTYGVWVPAGSNSKLMISTSVGSVYFFDFPESKDYEGQSGKSTLNYKIQETYFCFKERIEGVEPIEGKVASSSSLEVMKDKIVKLTHNSVLGLTFAISRKNVGIFDTKKLMGSLGIVENSEKLWNIRFDWVAWELEDLESTISTIEEINDKKMNEVQKNQMKVEYFNHYYGSRCTSKLIIENNIESIPLNKLKEMKNTQLNVETADPIVTLTLPSCSNNKDTRKLMGMQSNTVAHTLNFANLEKGESFRLPGEGSRRKLLRRGAKLAQKNEHSPEGFFLQPVQVNNPQPSKAILASKTLNYNQNFMISSSQNLNTPSQVNLQAVQHQSFQYNLTKPNQTPSKQSIQIPQHQNLQINVPLRTPSDHQQFRTGSSQAVSQIFLTNPTNVCQSLKKPAEKDQTLPIRSAKEVRINSLKPLFKGLSSRVEPQFKILVEKVKSSYVPQNNLRCQPSQNVLGSLPLPSPLRTTNGVSSRRVSTLMIESPPFDEQRVEFEKQWSTILSKINSAEKPANNTSPSSRTLPKDKPTETIKFKTHLLMEQTEEQRIPLLQLTNSSKSKLFRAATRSAAAKSLSQSKRESNFTTFIKSQQGFYKHGSFSKGLRVDA